MTAPKLRVLAREKLGLRPVIAYVRKSSEAADAQVLSHEQQLTEIHKKVAADDIVRVFRDSISGRTFEDRPGFSEMLDWCRRHEQPRAEPGRIIVWKKDRLGRALVPGTTETDHLAWDAARVDFGRVGWEFEFVVGQQRTGNAVGDRLLDTIENESASDYLRALTLNTVRGRNASARAGYWASGRAPFPAMRADARTRRVLAEAERDERGVIVRDAEGRAVRPSEKVQVGAKVVLVPDPERVRHWTHGAQLLLNREPWANVVRYYQQHVRTALGKSIWTRKGLRMVYSNPALVGVIERVIDGKVETIPAQWAPVVDPDLFERVQRELARRDAIETGRERAAASTYAVRTMICAGCGAAFHGGKKRGGGQAGAPRRYYVHEERERMPRDVRARAEAVGCKHYMVPADQVEGALRDFIVTAAGSPEWTTTMRRLFDEAGAHKRHAETLVTECRDRVRRAEVAFEANMRALDEAPEKEIRDAIMARLRAKNADLAAAKRDLAAAEGRVATAGSAWDEVAEMVDESLQVAAAWDTGDVTARQKVLDWWCDMIAVKATWGPGRTGGRVLQKELLVWLRTSPNDPKIMPLASSRRPRDPDSPDDGGPDGGPGGGGGTNGGDNAPSSTSGTTAHRSPRRARTRSRPGWTPWRPATAASGECPAAPSPPCSTDAHRGFEVPRGDRPAGRAHAAGPGER